MGSTIIRQLSKQDFFIRANFHMGKGDPKRAVEVCLQGLEHYPDDAKILCLAGRSLIAQRQVEEARPYIEKARSLHPFTALAHENYGDLMILDSCPGEAVRAYRQAAKLDPGHSGIEAKIGRARGMRNQLPLKDGKPRQTLAFPKEMARAAQLERDGEPGKAENIYRDILRRDSTHVEAMRLLAAVAVTHRKYRDAEVFLQQAVSLAPNYARLWLDLSSVQMEQDRLEEAIGSARSLVELMPDAADSHLTLGNALAKSDKAEEAIVSYQAALDIAPRHPGAFSGLGQQLKTVGRSRESIATYRQNIAFNPELAEPYWSLANMKTFRFTDGEMEAMETMMAAGGLDELGTVQLCNALGLGYEGRGEFDRAFEYFQRCNEKRRESEIYDPVETEVNTTRFIDTFSKQFIRESEGHGVADASPILIVGLPRSGSTLIEQILASHSQVEGTHELSDLSVVVRSSPGANSKNHRFPENLPGLKAPAWARIGNRYLERTEKYRRGAPRFIDKNPNNFIYAGLLHLVLPNAKIINARRHPLDSCFGSYKQLFAKGQPFTYDLTEVGEYYLQYQRIMDHWQEVLPAKVLDVDYEDVVSDLDTQVRRILDYCELPFEEACLNFHETDRAVKTASSEQVRQPIYATSVDLWKNYEHHLAELIEVLQPLLGQKDVK